MFCPQCKSEYRDGFTRCSDCGAALVVQLSAAAAPSEPDFDADTEFVVVRTYTKEVDVDLARSVLEAAGIQSIIKSGYFGESSLLPRVHGIHLVVRSEDAADADRILSIDANESNPWNDEV